MTPGDFVLALRPVVALLRRLGIRHYIGGSVASSAWGVARASVDVDVVADLQNAHADEFALALSDEFYVDAGRVRAATKSRGSFNLIHLATMIKVDIFVSRQRAFDESALARAREEALGEDEAERFAVAAPEDVVLAKLEWFRRGDEVSERQWSDVLGVLRVSGDALDQVYLRRMAAELKVLDLLERAIEAAAS